MTKFIDGPAKDYPALMLRSAPIFLRVVIDRDKHLDALDQPEDDPRPGETCHAYELDAEPGVAFIDGPKCRGRYPISNYRLCATQPTQGTMRLKLAWVAWCETQPLPEWVKKNSP